MLSIKFFCLKKINFVKQFKWNYPHRFQSMRMLYLITKNFKVASSGGNKLETISLV